jgi:anti-anti-sigma factor
VGAEHGFNVEVRRDGGRVVVAPSGELDLATVGQLRSALQRSRDAESLVLDLHDVTFMDSVGVGLVLEEHRRAQDDGGDFRLRRGPEHIQRLLEMTGLAPRLRWDEDGVPETARDGRPQDP